MTKIQLLTVATAAALSSASAFADLTLFGQNSGDAIWTAPDAGKFLNYTYVNPDLATVGESMASRVGSTFRLSFEGARKLDAVSFVIGTGTDPITLRLYDLGGFDPSSSSNDLVLDPGQLVFSASAASTQGGFVGQEVKFELTGAQEVSLTSGNNYYFELESVAGFAHRYGGGQTSNTDGSIMFRNRSNYAGLPGPRDMGMAVYTALAAAPIPEPSTYAAIFGAAALAFGLLRRRAR